MKKILLSVVFTFSVTTIFAQVNEKELLQKNEEAEKNVRIRFFVRPSEGEFNSPIITTTTTITNNTQVESSNPKDAERNVSADECTDQNNHLKVNENFEKND